MDSSGNGDKDRTAYVKEQIRATNIVALELRRRLGTFDAVAVLLGGARGILHADLGQLEGDRRLKELVEEVTGEVVS